ncbi:MAG: lipopolysaccharide heptosyltransferase II [Candidatus Omnitrophota bacterium]
MKKRILIVNVNWLGDVLLSTAAIRAIKKANPEGYIACMVVGRCVEILKDNPYLDEIIVFDEKKIHKSLIAKIDFIKELKKKKFDVVFLFHRSFTRTLITFLAGIPERAGYYTRKRGFLLTKKVPSPKADIHRLENFLNIIQAYGIESDGKYYDFFISEDDRKFSKEILVKQGFKEGDFITVINPGGNWEPKRWPKENFAKLADRLNQELKAKIIISGADKDIVLANQIASLMKTKPIILAGKTTLKQLGVLMKESDLVISADSGPMHIAAAVGTNLIALFGPTSPEITGPIGKGRIEIICTDVGCEIPCYKASCDDYRCMEEISVEDVFQKVKQFRN